MVSLQQPLPELQLPGLVDEQDQETLVVPTTKSLRHTLGLARNTMSQYYYRYLPPFPAIVGHRGALYAQLENTRESFRQCASWGCEAVELDVFVLQDGNVIVFHGGGTDENPGDLTEYCLNQERVGILDLDYPTASKLQFNPNFAEFACCVDKITQGRIPLLSQVLEDLRGTRTRVKIELKHPGTVQPVLDVVEQAGMVHQCSYSSFNHQLLQELRRLRPSKLDYPTGALFNHPVPDSYIEQALECGATEVHLRYDTCTLERVQDIRWAGLRSMAWMRGPRGMAADIADRFWDVGNEDAACYAALWETGVDEICINKPDVAIALRNSPAHNSRRPILEAAAEAAARNTTLGPAVTIAN